MVETTGKQTRADIDKSLMTKALEIYDKAGDLKIVIQREDPAITGKLLVRQAWDEDKMVSVADARVDGLAPEDFKEFFQNWEQYGAEANPILKEVELVETTPEGQKVCKMIVKTPWPIWNRCLISAFYNNFD